MVCHGNDMSLAYISEVAAEPVAQRPNTYFHNPSCLPQVSVATFYMGNVATDALIEIAWSGDEDLTARRHP
jgi:hypothetical protein